MKNHGTLKIWIAINTLQGRPSFKTIETLHDVSEEGAREAFTVWQENNPHMPFACAKWVPDVVFLR